MNDTLKSNQCTEGVNHHFCRLVALLIYSLALNKLKPHLSIKNSSAPPAMSLREEGHAGELMMDSSRMHTPAAAQATRGVSYQLWAQAVAHTSVPARSVGRDWMRLGNVSWVMGHM